MSYGDRWDQTKAAERLGSGTGTKGQSADGTFTAGHFPKYRSTPDDGALTDGGVPVTDLLTTTGAGGTTAGLSSGSSTYGSWVGQVPRGVVDGSNTRFYLDYNLLDWFTVLNIGDRIQLPGVQLDPNNEPSGIISVPGGEYQVGLGKNFLTVAHSPQPGQEFFIWYWRADGAGVGVSAALTTTTAYTVDPASNGDGIITIGGSGLKSSNVSWAKTTDTFDVTTSSLPIQLTEQAGVLALKVYFYSDNGTRFISGIHDILDIYDCDLTVTFADLSQIVYRPTTYGFDTNTPIAQMVEDPPNYASAYAVDGDPDTFARYDRTLGGSFLSIASQFWVAGFVPTSSAAPPTPVPLPTGTPIIPTGSSTVLTPTDSGSPVIITGSTPSTVTLPPEISAPSTPTLGQTTGGTLGARTLYARISYTNASGETLASAEASFAVSANHLLTITSPSAATGATGYNVYVGTTSSGEVKQTFTPVPIGTDWTEPSTGVLSSGPATPATNTASPDGTFASTIVNGSSSTVTVQAPTGTTINGSTSPVVLSAGQTAQVFTDGAGHYTVAVTGSGTGSGAPTTPLLGSDGTPLVDPASGEWIFNA